MMPDTPMLEPIGESCGPGCCGASHNINRGQPLSAAFWLMEQVKLLMREILLTGCSAQQVILVSFAAVY